MKKVTMLVTQKWYRLLAGRFDVQVSLIQREREKPSTFRGINLWFSTFSCVPWAGSFEAKELDSAMFLKQALAWIQHCEK